MTKSKIFLAFSLSFILGIFLASTFKLDVFWIYFFSTISIIVITLGYKNKKVLIAGITLLFLVFGIWRTNLDLEKINRANLDDQKISEIVTVIKEPEVKDNYQNIVVKTGAGYRILLRTDINNIIKYGDELNLDCLLKIPENRKDFDYRMYLAKDKIYYLCQNAKFIRTGKNSGHVIYTAILSLKNKLAENINRVIPYPESALGNGLIFGGSSELPKNLKDNFSKTGMTHIVAVSGYNVSIIAEYLILFGIFLGLWRQQAFWFAVSGIVLFVAMIGFPSSAVRAGVMGTLLLWAMKNGRLANSWNAIIFAAVIMLLINPLLLRWDIGFQLSFLATIGIVAFAPFWEKYLLKRHQSFGIIEIILLTISAQIFVLPVILYNFHLFSVVSLLANILILTLIPVSMLLTFLTSVAGLLGNLFSLPFAWLAYLLLKYETSVINLLASLEWSSLEVRNFSVWAAVFWYLLLVVIILFFKKQQRQITEKTKDV